MRAMLSSGLLAVALAACAPQDGSHGRGRGVLVIAIDALRADHLSCFGYDRPTTPVIDSLAEDGIVFRNVFSTSPDLLPAHAALMTGCDPRLAERPLEDTDDQPLLARWYIPEAVPRVAQEFLANGWRTAAIVDQPMISPVFGFGGGFQQFFGFDPEDEPPRTQMGFDAVMLKFKNWLTEVPVSTDWFAYLHLNDLERLWVPDDSRAPDPRWDTYFPPREDLAQVPPVAEADEIFFAIPRSRWNGGTMSLGEYEARYDGALKHLDTKMNYLRDIVRRAGRDLDTTIVVVGTYGFGLGEAGLYLDSGTLSDVDLRVPLIVRPAASLGLPKGASTLALASLVDVGPTLLDLAGLERPAGMHGVSLAPLVRGEEGRGREYAYATGGLQSGWAVFDARWCLERSAPVEGAGRRVAASWYGEPPPAADGPRLFLHDRASAPGLGHLGAPSDDREAARRLEAAGRDWYLWIDRARDALHGVGRAEPSTAAELRRRGLIR